MLVWKTNIFMVILKSDHFEPTFRNVHTHHVWNKKLANQS